MNSHQRRKFQRQTRRSHGHTSPPVLVKDWADLAKVPASKTHRLEIEVENGNGWVHEIGADPDKLGRYLSTHTFYGTRYADMTAFLQRCGFNIQLANWDA